MGISVSSNKWAFKPFWVSLHLIVARTRALTTATRERQQSHPWAMQSLGREGSCFEKDLSEVKWCSRTAKAASLDETLEQLAHTPHALRISRPRELERLSQVGGRNAQGLPVFRHRPSRTIDPLLFEHL